MNNHTSLRKIQNCVDSRNNLIAVNFRFSFANSSHGPHCTLWWASFGPRTICLTPVFSVNKHQPLRLNPLPVINLREVLTHAEAWMWDILAHFDPRYVLMFNLCMKSKTCGSEISDLFWKAQHGVTKCGRWRWAGYLHGCTEKSLPTYFCWFIRKKRPEALHAGGTTCHCHWDYRRIMQPQSLKQDFEKLPHGVRICIRNFCDLCNESGVQGKVKSLSLKWAIKVKSYFPQLLPSGI